MREQHPDPEALARFAVGELAGAEGHEIERHLAVCSDCRDRADEALDLLALPLLDGLCPGYDEAFDRALLGAAEQLAGLRREDRSAEDLLAELLREPAAGRQRKIREDERFHSLKLGQLLRTHSSERWFSDPAAARDLAELAVGVAEQLSPQRYGAMLIADARALSWAYLGNACRITSDPWRAERALHQAWSHHRRGSGDVDTESELLLFTSSLRIVQDRFDEAVRIADQAIAFYRSLRDVHREGSALLKKGIALGDAGRYREAIAATRAGLLRIDAAKDPRLLLIGKQNLTWDLIECGEHREAGRLLEELRSPGRESTDGMILARLDWIEGCLAGYLGRFTEAERRLRETRDFFLHHDSGADVFLVSLHLAELHARAGQPRRVRTLLGEMIPLGEAMELRRETLAARLLYEQAARR
jgi:tetratricopeptide (TPR) repeat protein